MKRMILISAFSLFSFFSCKGYQDLDVAGFEKRLSEDSSVQLVDVRTAEEFAAGYIPGAVNIDWKSNDFQALAERMLSTQRPVLLYCRSGRRSAAAAQSLSKAGYEVFNLVGGFIDWSEAGKAVAHYEVERFLTDSGAPVDISLIKHASLELRYKGMSIQVDPVKALGQKETDYATEFPKADFILVTHEHFDHYDQAAIGMLTGEKTQVVTNARVAQMLEYGTVMANGDALELLADIRVEAIPAYNTTEGHLQFHPKGRDNGYVLTIDGLRIYIAGDTEDIPEMASLKDIDVAFLPVNQPYTMTPEQCIHAAKVIGPKVLIPYHYSNTDLSGLPSALPEMDVRIRQLQ